MPGTAVVLITGLGGKAKISNGMLALREKLLPLDLAMLEVFPHATDADELAVKIQAVNANRTIIIGHSWGAWKSTKVAALLPYVDDFFSVDGVTRDRPRVLTIPASVRRFYSWRQCRNKIINGSDFIFTGPTELVVDAKLNVKHNQIDDEKFNPELHACVLKACTTTE